MGQPRLPSADRVPVAAVAGGPDAEGRVGVAVLGATGSVGRQTLEVVAHLADRFRVVALAAGNASSELAELSRRYRPSLVATASPPGRRWGGAGELMTGPDSLLAAALHPDAAIVVVATSGHAGIEPTLRAIEAGKTIALANKETIVCAGALVLPLARRHNVEIRPVDSEHSAIWQCLAGAAPGTVDRLHLTASGGPFREWTAEQLAAVTPEQALAHPTWAMGGKITVDSATLMNKGLEVIEAHWLFDVPYARIEVLIHPESVVHSLVEFVDGSHLAQLGPPDMRLPIQYALTYPDRLPTPGRRLSLADIGRLRFERPDEERFPALRLARQAGQAGFTYPTVLSAADDVAVAAFLAGRLRFVDIAAVVERTLDAHRPGASLDLPAILAADQWARARAAELIGGVARRGSGTGIRSGQRRRDA